MFSNMNKPKQRKNEQRRSESDFFVFVSLPAIKKNKLQNKTELQGFQEIFIFMQKKKQKNQNGHIWLN